MADLTGEQFGNYRLERLIGKGGFADVYLGHHIYLHTQAAIKILQVRLTHDALESFLGEARTVVQLDHPHIVRVLECSVEKNLPFLAMNYAPGGSLRQRYALGTRLPLEQVAQYISQIASALQYAHDRKLIHRDIKPENMLLSQDDRLLLSDFGLVILAQSTGAQTIKEMAGTVPYMAPEQLQGKPRAASDQYALAIVAYELLSGDRPFHGSFVEVASQHVLSMPPALYGNIPGISRAVEQVVFKALAKNPDERFPSVQAFADALAQASRTNLNIGQSATPLPNAFEFGSTQVATGLQMPISSASGQSGLQGALSTPIPHTPVQPFSISGQSAILRGEPSQSNMPTYISHPRMYTMPGHEQVPMSHSSTTNPTNPQFFPQTAYAGVPYAPQRPVEKPRSSRTLIIVLLSLGLILLFVLTPLLFFPNLRQTLGFGTQLTPTTGTGAITTPTTQTASTSTTTPALTPTTTSTATPTFTPTLPPTFSVTGVSASVNPNNFHGNCTDPMTFTFTGIIHAPAGTDGGTVSYAWLRSNNTTSSPETITFNPGETYHTVTTTWQLGSSWGNGTTLWEALEVTAPNAITSHHANFSFMCETPSFTVTSITASVSPGTYTCGVPRVTFYFTAVISLPAGSPGGSLTYTWTRSDGATAAPVTISVPAGQNSVTVTDSWQLSLGVPNNTYWERVEVSTPNSIQSNKATFTVAC